MYEGQKRFLSAPTRVMTLTTDVVAMLTPHVGIYGIPSHTSFSGCRCYSFMIKV